MLIRKNLLQEKEEADEQDKKPEEDEEKEEEKKTEEEQKDKEEEGEKKEEKKDEKTEGDKQEKKEDTKVQIVRRIEWNNERIPFNGCRCVSKHNVEIILFVINFGVFKHFSQDEKKDEEKEEKKEKKPKTIKEELKSEYKLVDVSDPTEEQTKASKKL